MSRLDLILLDAKNEAELGRLTAKRNALQAAVKKLLTPKIERAGRKMDRYREALYIAPPEHFIEVRNKYWRAKNKYEQLYKEIVDKVYAAIGEEKKRPMTAALADQAGGEG